MRGLRTVAVAALALAATCGSAAAATPVTMKSKPTPQGLGPLKVGMTLDEARAATGQKIVVTKTAPDGSCAIAQLYPKRLGVAVYVAGHAIVGTGEVPPPVPPDHIRFVLIGQPDRPRGGLLERFQGHSLPFLAHHFGGTLKPTPLPSADYLRMDDYWIDFPRSPFDMLMTLDASDDLVQIAAGKVPKDRSVDCPAA